MTPSAATASDNNSPYISYPAKTIIQVCFLILLVVTLWHHFGLASEEISLRSLWVVAAIKILPLLLMLPAVITGKRMGLLWACFVVQVYLCAGVLAFLNSWLWGTLLTGPSVVLCLVVYLEIYQRRKRARLAARS